METRERKKELRREVRARKAMMSRLEMEEASAAVLAELELTPEFAAADTVLAYWSMPDELDTHEAVRRWAETKRVLLPAVVGEILELREYRPESMVEGYKGIMEPVSPSVAASEVGLVIVPGVAFTLAGERLGRGGGFYDRLLSELSCPKFGVAFACQIYGELPVESHDSKIDKVFTDAK